MDKRDYLIILYDYYESLLNEKQREYFCLYYFDNLSLSEISEELGVSRNAVHKSLKSVEKLLIEYEDKLKIYYKSIEIAKIVKNTNIEKDVLEVLRID